MFFCYTWRRPCGEPFYVGIGDADRLKLIGQRNKYTNMICDKIRREGGEVLVEHEEFATREEAAAREIELIALYGRRDLGRGPLTNLTDGGEYGVPGSTFNIGRKHSAETRAKLSEQRKGNTHLRGKKLSAETRAKMSVAAKGNQNAKGLKHTEETKARIRAYRFTDEQMTKVLECNARRKRDDKGRLI